MSVTSAEVARRAGVSRATVSYVLNDAPGHTVSAKTRETVLKIAAELGYRPNVLARSLKRGRTENVVFPLPGLQMIHPFSLMLDACAKSLEPLGLNLVRDFTRHDEPQQQFDAWARLAPTAVIDLLLRHDDPVLALLHAGGIPVLSASIKENVAWESTNDVFARQQRILQMEYLLSEGHKQITSVIPRSLPVHPRIERELFSLLRRNARDHDAELTIVRAEPHEVAAIVASWKLESVDAVAAHNDDYALAVLTALLRRGAKVPDDVAVMGIDDIPLGRIVSPALTTLTPDFDAFAESVAEVVKGIVAGSKEVGTLELPGSSLIKRESA